MQALKDLLPGMFGAELGFLVILGGKNGGTVLMDANVGWPGAAWVVKCA